MKKIRLLDLCCGAGGCAMGYKLAADDLGMEIEIVGVDLADQKNYPFKFIQDDALSFLIKWGRGFTHIHASPPCQEFSAASNKAKQGGKKYNSILCDVRSQMYKIGLPGVIENVVGSPLIKDIELSGNMFDLGVIRHRIFEIVNWFGLFSQRIPLKNAIKTGRYITVAGQHSAIDKGDGRYIEGTTFEEKRKFAMGIHWMTSKELRQAIPPAYTRYIGNDFLKA